MVTPRGAQFVDLAHAALAKVDVAHGQGLVHEQNFRIHVDGHGEGQPYNHAAGIGFHGLVHEIADLGELFDLAVFLLDLSRSEPQDGAVQEDVVASGELGVEARAQLEQRRDPPVHLDLALGGSQNAGHQLQQGAFPGPVFADDAEGLAPPDFEIEIAQRPEIPVEAQAIKSQQFLEAIQGRVVDRVALGKASYLDGVHGSELSRWSVEIGSLYQNLARMDTGVKRGSREKNEWAVVRQVVARAEEAPSGRLALPLAAFPECGAMSRGARERSGSHRRLRLQPATLPSPTAHLCGRSLCSTSQGTPEVSLPRAAPAPVDRSKSRRP
jgi:hypothetical protein